MSKLCRKLMIGMWLMAVCLICAGIAVDEAKARDASNTVLNPLAFTDDSISLAVGLDKTGVFGTWNGSSTDYSGLAGVRFSLLDTVDLEVRGMTNLDGNTSEKAFGLVTGMEFRRFAFKVYGSRGYRSDTSVSPHNSNRDSRLGGSVGFGW